MNYKTISFILDSNNSIVEFDLNENMILEEKEFVLKMTTLLEFIGYEKPKKVILTNGSNFLAINKVCQDYARSYIFDAMKDYGVENIYIEI